MQPQLPVTQPAPAHSQQSTQGQLLAPLEVLTQQGWGPAASDPQGRGAPVVE